ncbi:MAG: sigma-70 family RNA polymerase sigma factor [Actinophytocola sp.]|nr:sigma-70 family RNA polymerase sigma factor [Actinophytocola sp.]
MSDADVVTRVLAGDTDAYAVLVRRHGAVARRMAVLFGAGDDADDVVQEAFVKAYRALGRFRGDASFRPWLLRIVANEVHNLVRSSRRRDVREHVSVCLSVDVAARWAEEVDPVSRTLSTERREALLAAVGRLGENYRAVVCCRYLLGLGEAETAVVLGWPRGTVKSRLSRALKRLSTDLAVHRLRTEEVGHARG